MPYTSITNAQDAVWSVDTAHTGISFKVKHLMISTFSGVSREFGATVIITSNDSTSSKIDFWMNPYSVDTNEKKRNGHLKSQDYLDLRKFEKITFISDSFE